MLTKKQIKHLTRALKTGGVMIKSMGYDAKNKEQHYQVYYISYDDRGTPFIKKLIPIDVDLNHSLDFETFVVKSIPHNKKSNIYTDESEILFKTIYKKVIKQEPITSHTFEYDTKGVNYAL